MIWVAVGALLLTWFVLLIGGIFLGGLIHLLLLAAGALAISRWLFRVPTA